MHVLTLTPFYPSTADDAQGCFVAEPLAALQRLGIENTVFAVQPFYRPKTQASDSGVRAEWVRYLSLPGGLGLSSAGSFLFARILPLVRRLHRDNGVDVVHAHAALPSGHAAALLSKELKIPFVVSVHGLDVFSTNQVRGLPGKWCERVSRMVFATVKRVICISERVRDEVYKGASAAVTEVIYNGVDTELFRPGETNSNETVLSVGNLIPIKGHATLLRAVAAVAKDRPALTLEKDHLQTLARELGIADGVKFLGRESRRQVADAMRRCAIFALPSRYEGLGCVYLEAMACERPVIACAGQGIAEIIRNSQNGILIDPDNAEQLASSLSMLLADPNYRRAMGTAGRRTVLAGLTLEHQARRLARVYEECLR